MNRNELTIKGDGAVCLYSCEECGDVLLVCQLCGNETEHPDPDSHRTPECLYTVNLNIIWNHESDGGETVSDVELVSFRSETAARDFLGDVMDRMALNQFQTRVRELAAGMGCQIVGDLGADQIQIHPPAGMRFRGLNKMAGDRNHLHAHCRDGGVPEPAWETLYGQLCKGLEAVPAENRPQSLIGNAGNDPHKDRSGAPIAPHGPELNETRGKTGDTPRNPEPTQGAKQ